MGAVERLEDLRDRRAVRRALRMVAQGYLQGGRIGAGSRELAQQIGLSDISVSVAAAQEALAAAARAGDMLGVAESHRILGLLRAGKEDWSLAVTYARLSLAFGTLHEVEVRLLLAMSATRNGGDSVEQDLQAVVQICSEMNNLRYQRAALLELAVLSLEVRRPTAAWRWVAALGQVVLEDAWYARHLGLLHWAGRQMGAAGIMQSAAGEIARVALDSTDPGVHALVHWVLAKEDWDSGRLEEAAYQAHIGRQRVASALLAHQTPTYSEILPHIACNGLLGLVDTQLTNLITQAEAAAPPPT